MTTPTFRLVLPTFPFSSCLKELRAQYSFAFRAAGYSVTLSDQYLQPGEQGEDYQVAFGAHVIQPPKMPDDHSGPDPRLIIAQSEHHLHWFTGEYVDAYWNARLIMNMGPFSASLADGFEGITVQCEPGIMPLDEVSDLSPLHYWPFGDDSEGDLARRERDIQVLFYGSINARRAAILAPLQAAGIDVVALYSVFGAKRDAYIDRAQVVLDLKQQGDEPDDQTRAWWPLSRGACVLSENAPRGSLAHVTPETVLDSVRTALEPVWNRRAREQYCTVLGACDVTPVLRALGL